MSTATMDEPDAADTEVSAAAVEENGPSDPFSPAEQDRLDGEEADLYGEDIEPYAVPSDLYPIIFPRWATKDTLDARVYRSLYAEIELEAQPQNLFAEMEVVEITNAFWQQQQIQNGLGDIVRAARRDALATILAPMLNHHYDRAVELAGDYFSGDLEKRQTVGNLLRSHGMGPEAISAQAIAQRAPVLHLLNRTATALGIRRDQIAAAVMDRREARARRQNRKQN